MMKKQFTWIAGPCVIESYELCEQVLTFCQRLAKTNDIRFVFKASFDKANRTSVDSYRGPGLVEGLQILQSLKETYGVQITTDGHKAYINAVETVMSELTIVGHDIHAMYDSEVATFSVSLAVTIQETVPHIKTLFGKTEMDPSDLQSRATAIANLYKGQDKDTLLRNARAITLGAYAPGAGCDVETNVLHSPKIVYSLR